MRPQGLNGVMRAGGLEPAAPAGPGDGLEERHPEKLVKADEGDEQVSHLRGGEDRGEPAPAQQPVFPRGLPLDKRSPAVRNCAMLVIHVFAKVKPECAEAFAAASIENARQTLEEPGAVRFDVMRSEEDPCSFVFVEAYLRPEDHLAHRETAHYKKWRDTVEPMMAEPRTAKRYTGLFAPSPKTGS